MAQVVDTILSIIGYFISDLVIYFNTHLLVSFRTIMNYLGGSRGRGWVLSFPFRLEVVGGGGGVLKLVSC